MNTKILATIVVSSVASYLLLTTFRGDQPIHKRYELNDRELLVEEKAGGYTINPAPAQIPSKLGSELKFEIGQSENESVSAKFVFPTKWNDQYLNENLISTKNFQTAVIKYFNDLTDKLSFSGKLDLTGVMLNPVNAKDITLTHIELKIKCKIDPKLRVTRILQCQIAVANVAKQISVNELLVYLNAYSAVGKVVGVRNNSAVESDDCKKILIYKMFMSNAKLCLKKYIFTVESSATALPEMFDNSGSFDDQEYSDLTVDHVEDLGKNFYHVYAFLNGTFEVDELFKCVFKNYTVENMAMNLFFSESSRIAVDNIHSGTSDAENQTLLMFDLLVVNIIITEEDLELNEFTMFDEIFNHFNSDEFRYQLTSVEECKSLIENNMKNDQETTSTSSAATTTDNTTTEGVSDTTHIGGINDDSMTSTTEIDSDSNKSELTEGSFICDLLFLWKHKFIVN